MNKTLILTNEQIQILSKYHEFGFKNENAFLNYAILLVQKEIQRHNKLIKSADLYSEIYKSDIELQDLTNTALNDLI